LRPGDIVRRIGSMPIRRIHDVRDALFFSRPGEYLTIEIDRDGRPLDWALPVEAAGTESDSESTDGPASGSPDLSTNKPLPPGSQFVPADHEPRLDLPRDFDPETN
jgi:hypothetical protein